MFSIHNIIRVVVIVGVGLYFVGRYYDDKSQAEAQMSAAGSLNAMLAAPSEQPIDQGQANDSSETTQGSKAEQDQLTYCKAISEFAKTTMEFRQHGVPMKVVMDDVIEETKGIPLAMQHSQDTVTLAYNEPQFDSENDRIQAAYDFKDKILPLCMQTFKST